ncbi:D-alanine--poly(phosphoribitol) ligase [Paraeggerthella hongkongensis]|uniref:D-alanine--poly(phosphoribitol) ligase subunit DltA n=1 Tax=Paraeggerthella sp. TaxID=2897350 RepID=UPI000DF7C6A6|nr:D-alanine--poly(phosphoribitol) ligase [Paraeggerthella hongkongensis]
MQFLDRVRILSKQQPNAPVLIGSTTRSNSSLTYGQLWSYSGSIAAHINEILPANNDPVIAYGHKSSLMLASFLACMRSGHAYVPIDAHSVPEDRVSSIAEQIKMKAEKVLVLASLPFPETTVQNLTVIAPEALQNIANQGTLFECGETAISGEDLMYIIFTSGSTGTPKGVQVTASCVDNFFPWALEIACVDKTSMKFLNQAPFSFDLSVYELTMALASGGTLLCLEKETLDHPAEMLQFFKETSPDIWVSTPSFADICLANKDFCRNLMPDLATMVFCGETLTNQTAHKVSERFPKLRIMNTYGPTESTVAVTSVEVSPEMIESPEPLTVGSPRTGTRIRIVDCNGSDLPNGKWGEIVIEGDTVAKGYFGRADLTAKSFGESDGSWLTGRQGPTRYYRTGDEGLLDPCGQLHFRGRLDLQVKLNGYRIELGEIEEHLSALDQVSAACVVPAYRNGRLTHLVAYIVSASPREKSDFQEGLTLKDALKSTLPHYMIPKKIAFIDSMPVTPNGKLDRKVLAAQNKA